MYSAKTCEITFYTCILYALLLPLPMYSQPKVVFLNQLTTDSGLSSQSNNFHVYKDRSNFIWINSQLGLNRFDGKSIKYFKSEENDSLSLVDNMVTSPFFEDPSGGLWLSSRKAVYRMDPQMERFSIFRMSEFQSATDGDLSLKFIDTIHQTGWLKAGNKLGFFAIGKPDSVRTIYESNQLTFRSSIRWNNTESTILLFHHEMDGLIIQPFQKTNEEQFSPAAPLRYLDGQLVNTSLYIDDASIWVGMEKGLARISLHENNPIFQFDGITNVEKIQQLDEKRLIVATQNDGIFIFNVERGTCEGKFFFQANGSIKPFEKEIESIYLDRDRTLWISSQGNGLYYTHLDKVKFQSYLLDENDNHSSGVKSITEDGSNRLWGISDYRIIVWDQEGSPVTDLMKAVNSNPPFKGDKLFTIRHFEPGVLLLGTQRGLYVFDETLQSFTKIPIKKKGQSQRTGVTNFYQLSTGQFLVATSRCGVYELVRGATKKAWQTMPWIDENKTFNWIHELTDRRFFANQYTAHLYLYDPTAGHLDSPVKIPHSFEISGLIEDTIREKVWIPSDKGLYYYDLKRDDGKIKRDSHSTIEVIQGLLLDHRGNLWMSTPDGLTKYNPDSTHQSSHFYTQPDGIQGNEFNFASCFKRKDGQLIFGGVNGLTVVDTAQVLHLSNTAYPVINSINIKGRSEIVDHLTKVSNPAFIKKIELRYKYNDLLQFTFAPREYSDPANAKIRYQLVRGKRDTIDELEADFARFTDLREGHYQLEVYAANSDGEWNPEPHVLKFRIFPPWWRSRWFLLLAGLTTIGAFYRYYQHRINSIRKKEKARREKAETETAILRLQMNPHFIFNSMNSIGGYIIKKDTLKAYDYLTKFGKLMRKMLNLADLPSIPLEEEVRLLEQYIKVEQMRFEEKLNYHIEIADEVDAESIEVPTMLLQPFVENAIKHGIAKKENGGEIRIGFQLIDDFLLATIEDDGIGREAAQSKGSSSSHQSKALEITENRLRLLREQTGKLARFEIKDLYDHLQQPCGTRVEIYLPIL